MTADRGSEEIDDNVVNSKMVADITGRSIREETQKEDKTFGTVSNIRTTRLKWLDYILRMDVGRMMQKAVNQIDDVSEPSRGRPFDGLTYFKHLGGPGGDGESK